MANNNSDKRVIRGVVIGGSGNGQKLGLRTANLDIGLAAGMKKGLYGCEISIDNKSYRGLLFFGLNSLTKKDALEVHIFKFSDNIYGKVIEITINKY